MRPRCSSLSASSAPARLTPGELTLPVVSSIAEASVPPALLGRRDADASNERDHNHATAQCRLQTPHRTLPLKLELQRLGWRPPNRLNARPARCVSSPTVARKPQTANGGFCTIRAFSMH